MTEYAEFLANKKKVVKPSGIKIGLEEINPKAFDFQRAVIRWTLHKGKSAVFAAPGLGKTVIQLSWADMIHRYTEGDILILAPLMVAQQTATEEAEKFGIRVNLCREQSEVQSGLNITNYERLHLFDTSKFVGVVADESGCLKSFTSAIRNQLIEQFDQTPYRLACTATPAPNDYEELGNHAEFLGVCTRLEMLSTFFTHDGGQTAKWRLKKHGVKEFWKWVASWAVMFQKPSDLGFSDEGFELPELRYHQIVVNQGKLMEYKIANQAITLKEQREIKRQCIENKTDACKELIGKSDDFWVVWCSLNNESVAMSKALNAIEITGSQKPEEKETLLSSFISGKNKRLVTKADIAGFGLNLQFCHKTAIAGIDHSFEKFYQLVRRFWRFGQTEPVDVYLVTDEAEGPIINNIKRKEHDFEEMMKGVISITQEITKENIQCTESEEDEYKTNYAHGNGWEIYLGDSVEIMSTLKDDSIDFSIFSPPYMSLYVYSNTPRDVGNCKDEEEFFFHFNLVAQELFRVIKIGRIVAVDCMNIPAMKERDGYIGIKNFRDKIVRLFENCGFVWHSEFIIWKDPLIENTRTHSKGLAHNQLCKDSTWCRAGLPQFLECFRKDGENQEPVVHPKGLENFYGLNPPISGVLSHQRWRRYASPIWMDVDFGDTLNVKAARDGQDERHVCPMSRDIIRRALELYTNPGDIVFDPFSGIGSSGDVAIRMKRKSISIELKESYYRQSVKNLRAAEISTRQMSLFEPQSEETELAQAIQ